MTVTSNVLGDLLDWVVGVFERIGDVSVYWLGASYCCRIGVNVVFMAAFDIP